MASIEKQLLGTETTQAMRAKGVNSIICGLSANDVGGQFLDSGADSFMLKPFPCEKGALTCELLQILGKANRSHVELLQRAHSLTPPTSSSFGPEMSPDPDSNVPPIDPAESASTKPLFSTETISC